jgi:hypothetical protein
MKEILLKKLELALKSKQFIFFVKKFLNDICSFPSFPLMCLSKSQHFPRSYTRTYVHAYAKANMFVAIYFTISRRWVILTFGLFFWFPSLLPLYKIKN